MNILIHIVILLNVFSLCDLQCGEQDILVLQGSFYKIYDSFHESLEIKNIFPQHISIKCIKEEEKTCPDFIRQKYTKPGYDKAIYFSSIEIHFCSVLISDNILFEADTSPPILYS